MKPTDNIHVWAIPEPTVITDDDGNPVRTAYMFIVECSVCGPVTVVETDLDGVHQPDSLVDRTCRDHLAAHGATVRSLRIVGEDP